MKAGQHKFKIRFAINGKLKTVNYQQIRSGSVVFSFPKAKVNPTKAKAKPKKIPKEKKKINSDGLRLMGLDIATSKTGYSVFNNTSLINSGMIRKTGDKYKRINKMCDEIMFRIAENNVNHVVIEDIYLSDKGETGVTAYKCLANIQGALIDRLITAKIDYTLVLAVQWKSFFKIMKRRDDGKDAAIELVKNMTGKVFFEDEAESILISMYALSNLLK